MAVTWYGADYGTYVEGLTDRINTVVEIGFGPMTPGILAMALVNPGNWEPAFAEARLREAFMESKAADEPELAELVISTLLRHHDTLLGLAG